MNDKKLTDAVKLLSEALRCLKREPTNPVLFAGVSKAFEVSFEYAWKHLKRHADSAGLEVYSPRDAIKVGAQLRLIDDIEMWDSFVNARNQSVHDYIGIADKDFLPLIIKFEKEVRGLLR